MYPPVHLVPAHSSEQLNEVRALFREFAAEIHVDLCFQGFERELVALPGDYAPPAGRLFLARGESAGIGCVALRRIDDQTCETKRLFVRPAWRGRGVGRMLTEAVIAAAREIGYARVRLDTLDTMTAAVALYRSLGFVDTRPYRYNPLRGATFLELELREAPGRSGAPPS